MRGVVMRRLLVHDAIQTLVDSNPTLRKKIMRLQAVLLLLRKLVEAAVVKLEATTSHTHSSVSTPLKSISLHGKKECGTAHSPAQEQSAA